MKHSGLIIGGGCVLILGLVFGGITIGGYNTLVKEDESTGTLYAQVQNLLKARHDKITELLAVVQAQVNEEQAIYQAIIDVRHSYTTDEPGSDAGETTAFNTLLALIEDNEPTFMSQESFISLMDEISEAENKLEVGRKDYNDSVRAFNTSIRMFPTNMVASMFGFAKTKDYWAVSSSDTEMPVISFSHAAAAAQTSCFTDFL
jgi:LemA protein